jgi:hypothetical protein
MSRAIAVCHGGFGRATIYQINRPFNVHTHREGHSIFHVGGSDGSIDVADRACPLTTASFVAVSPWEPRGSGALSGRRAWLSRAARNRTAFSRSTG